MFSTTSQKRALSHIISLAVNYRLFSHGDVSYRFNGKNDNAVLEFKIYIIYQQYFPVFHYFVYNKS